MARFTRPPGRTAGPTKINFAAAKKAILLDPGVYELQIERVELVTRGKNSSVALTLIHIASGQVVSTRPMWVAGPSARSGDLAEQNRAVIKDLLRLAGLPVEGEDTAALLADLAGLRILGDLRIASDQNGNPFNALYDAGPTDPDESVSND